MEERVSSVKQQPLKEYVGVVCTGGFTYVLLSSAQLLTLNKRRELVSLVPLAEEQSALTLAKGLGSALLAGCSGGVVRLV